jgi:hypothetical protein
MQVAFREPYSVAFETYVVYDDVDCDVAYGTLKIDAIVLPALRLCIHRYMHDFAVKIYSGYATKVKRTQYCLQVPPYRYVTYTDTPDVLLLMRPGGGAVVLLCNADAELCAKIHDMAQDVYSEEDAYATIKRLVEIWQLRREEEEEKQRIKNQNA